MSILVVGSVAFDTVETPFGRAEKVLGGSASFFAVAASFFAPVNLVGVVGDDFGEKRARGLPRPPDRPRRASSGPTGKTFHWQGKYSYDLNSRETICTDLNVFEYFKPQDPRGATGARSTCSSATSIRCCSARCWTQVERPQLVACDTMNFWITGKPEELRETLAASTCCSINDAEARQLSGEWNLVKAARAIRAMGPQHAGGQEGRARRADVLGARGLLRRARASRSRRSSIRPAPATPSPAASSATWRASDRDERGHAAPRRHHGQHARVLLRRGLQPGPPADADADGDRRALRLFQALTHFESV